MTFFTVKWDDSGGGALLLLEQTLLPEREEILRCTTPAQVIDAIQRLAVRGAPAIGVAAAYACALAAFRARSGDVAAMRAELAPELAAIRVSRPTAVNLAWAVDRMGRTLAESRAAGVDALRQDLLDEARAIEREDQEACLAIGRYGADLVPDGATVLTHCNAGALATAGRGTALAIVYEAAERGKRVQVLADETRPLLQGARLTAWECGKMGIPVTILCDNAAGWMMARGKVDCIVVGADRIAANGDVANKIGTYALAVLAKEHGIPFYVAAPTTTLDLAIASGREIPIEERSPEEVTSPRGQRITPAWASAHNPAFDVTPARFVTAIVTDQGVVRGDLEKGLRFLPRPGRV